MPLPPRSEDIHLVENILHIVKTSLQEDALNRNIMHETFEQLSECMATTIKSLDK